MTAGREMPDMGESFQDPPQGCSIVEAAAERHKLRDLSSEPSRVAGPSSSWLARQLAIIPHFESDLPFRTRFSLDDVTKHPRTLPVSVR